mmetsp:Transcript_3305/g.6865  ORF Transcript_3305/g.6865 Transcript_3305/m.6865 type:complete len:231 (-) Transcript_3305:262-954(-)
MCFSPSSRSTRVPRSSPLVCQSAAGHCPPPAAPRLSGSTCTAAATARPPLRPRWTAGRPSSHAGPQRVEGSRRHALQKSRRHPANTATRAGGIPETSRWTPTCPWRTSSRRASGSQCSSCPLRRGTPPPPCPRRTRSSGRRRRPGTPWPSSRWSPPCSTTAPPPASAGSARAVARTGPCPCVIPPGRARGIAGAFVRATTCISSTVRWGVWRGRRTTPYGVCCAAVYIKR